MKRVAHTADRLDRLAARGAPAEVAASFRSASRMRLRTWAGSFWNDVTGEGARSTR